MPLTKPALAAAEPGMPITAQSWNEIVDGLSELYDAVLALGSAVLLVEVTFGGQPMPSATVVAEPLGGEGNEVASIPPIGTRTAHLLAGLTPGQWRIRVKATGLSEESRDVDVPRSDPLAIAMEAAGSVLPDTFGLGLTAALTELAGAGVSADRVRVIDTAGREISANAVPTEHKNSDVLVQLPAARAVLGPTDPNLRLVIAAPLVDAESVTMPSLIGLTYDEMFQTLTSLGLRVGRTTVKSA